MSHENALTSNLQEVEIVYKPHPIARLSRKQVRSPGDAYRIFLQVFPSLEHREYFFVLCLTRSNSALGYSMISMGGINGTIADIRLIFQVAIKSNASGIIVAHNHPSGNLNPSQSDIQLTKRIKEAGNLLDIVLLDHLIISETKYYSFADSETL